MFSQALNIFRITPNLSPSGLPNYSFYNLMFPFPSFSSSSNISSNVMNGLFTLWLLDYAYGKPSNVPSTMSMLPSPEPVSVFSSMGQRTFPRWLRILRWQPSPELPRWVQYNLKQWTPVFFGSRDWFHGRLFFHRSGSGGWFGADSNTLHLLC